MGEVITANEARQFFEDCGLTYDDIRRCDIDMLKGHIGLELDRVAGHDGEEGKPLTMHVCRKDTYEARRGKFVHAFIRVSGPYFSHREGVSFNDDGFIGFCGWASDANTAPITEAFCKWCEYMRDKKHPAARLLNGDAWPDHGYPEEVSIVAPDGMGYAYKPRETCRIDTGSAHGMSCSRCGKRWANYMVAFSDDPLLGSGYARTSPKFCPNCGAENTGAFGYGREANPCKA